MKLRRINTKLATWKIAIVGFLGFALMLFFTKGNRGFLKYANKERYHPKNDTENAKGLIGKINAYLRASLDSVNPNTTNVFQRYPRLTLTYPVDTTDFATYGEVRLVGYLPITLEEKEFYYNSQFHKLLLQQQNDLSEEFFKISFSKDHRTIDSIVVDQTKLSTVLRNSSWSGAIKLKDPTLDWDPHRKFIICEANIIPLFSTTDTQNVKYLNVPGSSVNLTPDEIVNAFWRDPHKLLISVQGKGNFEIFQTGTAIKVTADSSFIIEYENKIYGNKHVFSGRVTNQNIFFKLTSDKTIIPVTITSKSPYEMGSQVANGANAGNTIDIDTSYADLYSRQIQRSIRLSIDKTDTLKEFKLSYDALQSKYYENFFRDSLLAKLQSRLGYDESITYDMNLTLVDISTGEIIAAPYYNNAFALLDESDLLFKLNYNLKSSSYEIASTFKPILAAACVLNYPSLMNYHFNATHFSPVDINRKIYKVNGMDIRWDVERPSVYFNNCETMPEFLARSHDGFPMGLVMNGFVGASDAGVYNSLLNNQTPPESLLPATEHLKHSNNRLDIFDIQQTYLCKSLDYVFGLPIDKKPDGNNYFHLAGNLEAPLELIPESTSLFGYDRDYLSEANTFDYDRYLRTWILGQGALDVNLFRLSQAYARLLSKRRINLTYMPRAATPDLIFTDPLLPENMAFANQRNPNEKENVWNDFLTAWADAQSMPVATFNEVNPGRNRVNNFNKFQQVRNGFDSSYGFSGLQVFFKTGTPDNRMDTLRNIIAPHGIPMLGKDDAMFVMAITNPLDSLKRNNAKGIVMIVHVSRRKILKTQAEATVFKRQNGLWGADVLNGFLTSGMIRNIIRFNKARF